MLLTSLDFLWMCRRCARTKNINDEDTDRTEIKCISFLRLKNTWCLAKILLTQHIILKPFLLRIFGSAKFSYNVLLIFDFWIFELRPNFCEFGLWFWGQAYNIKLYKLFLPSFPPIRYTLSEIRASARLKPQRKLD